MVRRCCVPHCYTGYRKSKERAQMETGSLFKVPDNKFLRKKWIKAIARDDRELNSKDFVCYKHFTDDDFIKRRYVKYELEQYKIPKLKRDAIPSIFPELPDHLLKIIKKSRKLEPDHIQDNAKLNNEEASGNKEDSANLSAVMEIQEDVIPEESGVTGQLSEEAQEASNKVFKRYREYFSRKMSREQTNEDVLKRPLLSCDPYISSLEKVRKPNKAFDKEVIEMLLAPKVPKKDLLSTESDELSSNSD